MGALLRVALGSMLAAGIVGTVVLGQQVAPTEIKPAAPQPGYTTSYKTQVDDKGTVYYQPVTVPNASYQALARSSQLVQQYVKAKDEEDKEKIREQLQTEVSIQFDAHMGQQQKELEELEKQLARLKSVLRKRQEAKKDIIDRRIDQLIRDAEGLGWNAPPNSMAPQAFSPFGYNNMTKEAIKAPAPKGETFKRKSKLPDDSKDGNFKRGALELPEKK